VVAQYFVPAVISIALLTFAVWWAGGGDLTTAMIRLVAVLVVACPCALGLATPTAIVVGTGKGAQHGILFKNSASLETAQRLDTIVLDKTGTLTSGEPVVTDIVVNETFSLSDEALLRLAASAERGSKGVRAEIDGEAVLVGRPDWLEAEGVSLTTLESEVIRLREEARTVVGIAVGDQIAGLLAIADTVKASSAEAVKQMRQLGLHVIMLTGDNESTAQAIASQVGINRVLADVLPADKANQIKDLQAQGQIVGMVGDGINDAPALAQADVGIALGTGTDIAMETADVTLIRGDLRAVAQALRLSRMTMRTIKQNLFWAFFYNVVLIPVAAGVLYSIQWLPDALRYFHPVLAAFAMAFSSVTVVSNSLRLRRVKL